MTMEKPVLSVRQAQVAECIAKDGLANKAIAHRIGIDIETVKVHVKAAAAKIPGVRKPREKLALWFFGIVEGGDT